MNDLFTNQRVKIEIIPVPVPMVTEFELMGKLDLSLVFLANEPIVITTSPMGKTMVNTSLQIKKTRVRVNWKLGDYKFHHKQEYNMFSHQKVDSYYFKNLKSQGIPEYKQYLEQLVREILKKDDYYEQFEGTVTVHWQDKINVNWNKIK